ncbi:winged helix DNA-binding domain-containing protein [Glaciibacter flavus]|uniref:winged helix DNA-binding domain-containing protein n=1 Tax=Orlajensenia flava TaxID=2565934 RepID=UPI003B00BA70
MRTISVEQRRRLMVQRHHLRGDAAGPEQVAAALIALHATDPASLYLSVLARSSRSTLADVSAALYERQTLVRWMAMRRTLFVIPRADVPFIQAAASAPLALTLRRQLLSRMRRNGTDPALDDPEQWLAGIERDVECSLRDSGAATGAQLSARVPALRTTILSGSPSEKPQNVTSPLLTLLGTEARIVRGDPVGPWTSRHHQWEHLARRWPDGLSKLDSGESQNALALRWLERYGPATLEDLRWWTGWNKTTVRRVVSTLPIEEVDLHGEPGIALLVDGERHDYDVTDKQAGDAPVAALLPSLDPTPMGWKSRAWCIGIDRAQIFDTAGNIGPTVWWDGEVIGSWAIANTGEVRTVLPADRGRAAAAAVGALAAQLQTRLDGAVVTPAVRTPLERSLVQS